MKTGILAQQSGKENPTNLLSNGDFENWSAGTAVAPDGWLIYGASSTVAREATIIKLGTYSAKLTRNGTDCNLYQTNIHIPKGIAYWKGRKIIFGSWVYSTIADRARLLLYDGVQSVYSSYHTGNSTWQLLTVTITVDASATEITPQYQVDTGNTSAYFDGAMCVEGESIFAFADNPLPFIGTWTPTKTGFTQAGGGSYTLSGTFTKIGRIVYITGKIVMSGGATIAGTATASYIGGLPFTSTNTMNMISYMNSNQIYIGIGFVLNSDVTISVPTFAATAANATIGFSGCYECV